jgi:hypothetical protein
MCNYCGEGKVMIKKEIISTCAWGWGNIEVGLDHALKVQDLFGLFIDKRCSTTYLRLANLEDCNCIESGEKIEIKFCPMCGDMLKE